MDTQELDILINLKKKTDAAQSKKDSYENLMYQYLKENGYTEHTERYIFEGFFIEGMSAFYKYLSEQSDKDKLNVYQTMVKGKSYLQNTMGSTFKRSLVLLALYINANRSFDFIMKDLIKKAVILSANKDGKRWSDFSKTVDRYFIQILLSDAILPILEDIDFANRFKYMMMEAVYQINPTKHNNILTLNKVKQWVGQVSENKQKISINENKLEVKIDKSVSEEETKTENASISMKTEKSRAGQLIEIAGYLDNVERDLVNQKRKQEELNQQILQLEKNISELMNEQQKYVNDISKLSEKNEMLHNEMISLQNINKQYEGKIKFQDNELQKRDRVLSVFQSDKESSQREQLNSIASKLRTEYQDFKDALDMEMTIDLGENMRQQLSSVFKILSKNGIDIERR